jgi:hypothetical protein
MVGIIGVGMTLLCTAGDGIIAGTEDGIVGDMVTTHIGILVLMVITTVGVTTHGVTKAIMEIIDITEIMAITTDVMYLTLLVEEVVTIVAILEF